MCRSAYSQFILAAIASATFVVFFSYTSRNIAAIVPVLVEPVSAHRPAAPPPVPLLSCASAPASAGLSISCSTGVMARLLFAAHGAVSGACPLPSEPVSCDGSPALPCPVYFRRSLSCDDKAFIRTASRACIGKQNCSLLPPADDPCPSVSKSLAIVALCSSAPLSGVRFSVDGSEAPPACNARWARAYARRHSDIISGASQPRFLIGVPTDTGFADRALSHISQFFWAVLSRRAVQFMERGAVSSMAAALQPRCIDWQVQRDAHPPGSWNGLMRDFGICDSCVYDVTRYGDSWGAVPTLHSAAALKSLYQDHNLTAWPPELLSVRNIVDSNKGGATRLLWQNQFHIKELRGIAALENATRVAWEFLFTPTDATLAAMRPLESELDNASLIIAIHARTGDKSFGLVPDPNREFGSFAEHVFFSCAAQLTERFANSTGGASRVRWFLSSDSLELRRAAKQRFGDLLVTDTTTVALHTGAGGLPDRNGHYNAAAMVSSVADMLLLAKGHLHVLSASSGFGRIGALLSRASGAHIAWGAEGAACASNLRTRLDSKFLGDWSGLR